MMPMCGFILPRSFRALCCQASCLSPLEVTSCGGEGSFTKGNLPACRKNEFPQNERATLHYYVQKYVLPPSVLFITRDPDVFFLMREKSAISSWQLGQECTTSLQDGIHKNRRQQPQEVIPARNRLRIPRYMQEPVQSR